MKLNSLLNERNMSMYLLSKKSGVPKTTVSDICSGKARIEKCSAETIYKIAKVLDVSMESLIEQEIEKPKRCSFETFKSNTCHLVKDKGDRNFIIDVLKSNEIRTLFDRQWYPEAFYLLAMVDYLSRVNDVPLCTNYNDIRSQKLNKVIYPVDVILSDSVMNTDFHRQECMSRAIPEFMRFNIVECEVRDVC